MVNQHKHCFFCGDVYVTQDNWCQGCKHYICDTCNKAHHIDKHLVEDHAGKPQD